MSPGRTRAGSTWPGRNERDCFVDFRGYANLAAEEIDNPAIQLPKRLRMRIQNRKQSITIINEKRRRIIRRLDGTLSPLHPRRRILHPDLLDRQRERPPLVHHRHIQRLRTIRSKNTAPVPVALLLIILAGLHINGRILRQKSEVFYGWKVCRSKQHYSMITFSRESLLRTIPRFEFLMKPRISSFSALSGKPCWIRAQASEILYPWK